MNPTSLTSNTLTPPVKSEVQYEDVYFIENGAKAEIYGPIAINPTIFQHAISWNDTSGNKQLKFSKIVELDNKKILKITTKKGVEITLIALTLDLFNKSVKELVSGNPNFKNDQELKDYYLQGKFLQ